jgi:hypothetical protein
MPRVPFLSPILDRAADPFLHPATAYLPVAPLSGAAGFAVGLSIGGRGWAALPAALLAFLAGALAVAIWAERSHAKESRRAALRQRELYIRSRLGEFSVD